MGEVVEQRRERIICRAVGRPEGLAARPQSATDESLPAASLVGRGRFRRLDGGELLQAAGQELSHRQSGSASGRRTIPVRTVGIVRNAGQIRRLRGGLRHPMVCTKNGIGFEPRRQQIDSAIHVRRQHRMQTRPTGRFSQRDGGLEIVPQMISQAVIDDDQFLLHDGSFESRIFHPL